MSGLLKKTLKIIRSEFPWKWKQIDIMVSSCVCRKKKLLVPNDIHIDMVAASADGVSALSTMQKGLKITQSLNILQLPTSRKTLNMFSTLWLAIVYESNRQLECWEESVRLNFHEERFCTVDVASSDTWSKAHQPEQITVNI